LQYFHIYSLKQYSNGQHNIYGGNGSEERSSHFWNNENLVKLGWPRTNQSWLDYYKGCKSQIKTINENSYEFTMGFYLLRQQFFSLKHLICGGFKPTKTVQYCEFCGKQYDIRCGFVPTQCSTVILLWSFAAIKRLTLWYTIFFFYCINHIFHFTFQLSLHVESLFCIFSKWKFWCEYLFQIRFDQYILANQPHRRRITPHFHPKS
jgi:hypothetical protein